MMQSLLVAIALLYTECWRKIPITCHDARSNTSHASGISALDELDDKHHF